MEQPRNMVGDATGDAVASKHFACCQDQLGFVGGLKKVETSWTDVSCWHVKKGDELRATWRWRDSAGRHEAARREDTSFRDAGEHDERRQAVARHPPRRPPARGAQPRVPPQARLGKARIHLVLLPDLGCGVASRMTSRTAATRSGARRLADVGVPRIGTGGGRAGKQRCAADRA
jgi:hypothetical protein